MHAKQYALCICLHEQEPSFLFLVFSTTKTRFWRTNFLIFFTPIQNGSIQSMNWEINLISPFIFFHITHIQEGRDFIFFIHCTLSHQSFFFFLLFINKIIKKINNNNCSPLLLSFFLSFFRSVISQSSPPSPPPCYYNVLIYKTTIFLRAWWWMIQIF